MPQIPGKEQYTPEPLRPAYGVVAGRSVQFASSFSASAETDVDITIALRMSMADIVATLWSLCHDTEAIPADDAARVDVELLSGMLDTGSVQVEEAMADIYRIHERYRRLGELVHHTHMVYTEELGREILADSAITDPVILSAADIVAIIWRKRQHDSCPITAERDEIRNQAVELMEKPVRNTVAFGKHSIEQLQGQHARLLRLAGQVRAVYSA